MPAEKSQLDTWLDALFERQERLEREFEAIPRQEEELRGRLGPAEGDVGAVLRSNAALASHEAALAREADAAGQTRADAAKRELDAARGRAAVPSSGSSRRTGVIRM